MGKRLFYIQYRGLDSIKYIKDWINYGAPIIPIYTTRQLKTMLPSLKPVIEKNYTSNVIYEIRCPGCDFGYVGMSSRHLITRIKEHFRPTGVITKHLQTCGGSMDPFTCAQIIDKTSRNIVYLSILEALHIREIKPSLNSKDEFKGRILRIRI